MAEGHHTTNKADGVRICLFCQACTLPLLPIILHTGGEGIFLLPITLPVVKVTNEINIGP